MAILVQIVSLANPQLPAVAAIVHGVDAPPLSVAGWRDFARRFFPGFEIFLVARKLGWMSVRAGVSNRYEDA